MSLFINIQLEFNNMISFLWQNTNNTTNVLRIYWCRGSKKFCKNYHITSVLIVIKSLTIIFVLYDCIGHFDFKIKYI